MNREDKFSRCQAINSIAARRWSIRLYVALPDGAVHIEGSLRKLTDRVLGLTNPDTVLPLDAVLASKLGEYTDLPPSPDRERA